MLHTTCYWGAIFDSSAENTLSAKNMLFSIILHVNKEGHSPPGYATGLERS